MLQYRTPRKRPCDFNLYGMTMTTCQIEEKHKAQNSIRHPLVCFNGLHRRFTIHKGSFLVLRWWTTSQHPTECAFVPKSMLTCPTHPQGKWAKASLFQPKPLNHIPGYQMRTRKQTRKCLWTLSTLFHLYWLWEKPQSGMSITGKHSVVDYSWIHEAHGMVLCVGYSLRKVEVDSRLCCVLAICQRCQLLESRWLSWVIVA